MISQLQTTQKRNALIICDLQNDLLKSIPPPQSNLVLKTITAALQCIREQNENEINHKKDTNCSSKSNQNWIVIYTGLKFQSGYQNVPPNHKLYGAMKKLNAKMGDNFAHWFMDGYDGVQITDSVYSNTKANVNANANVSFGDNGDEYIVWRDRHLLSSSSSSSYTCGNCNTNDNDNNINNINISLEKLLHQKQITHATICGIKTSMAVQSTIQLTCDLGITTSVLAQGVTDDTLERHEAIMTHLIPIYANVVSMSDFLDGLLGGLENMSMECREALIQVVEAESLIECESGTRPSKSTSKSTPAIPDNNNNETKNNVNSCHVNDDQNKNHHGETKTSSSSSSSPSSKITHPAKQDMNTKRQPQKIHFCTDCERGGHGERYIQFLLERNNNNNTNNNSSNGNNIIWKTYPSQPWYENFHGAFKCPLGKKTVDFCDEPEFSKLSMYLSGREWLDEKDKVVQFATNYMPFTYCWEPFSISSSSSSFSSVKEEEEVKKHGGKWKGGIVPPDDDEEGATASPWFIKEADKNLGGPYIGICQRPSEIRNFIKRDRRYVVQQHVKDPLLTDDGRKTHVKFYILLVCEEDGVTWTLYTYRRSKLSISPNRWSPTDLSQDTQITIHRHPVPPHETVGWKQHWEKTYLKCQQCTADVIGRAVKMGKLKGRKGKKQFEVFSADWMPDVHSNIWLFEFNMSPAVCQKEFDDLEKRDERRDKLMKDDEIMMRDALSIVLPWGGGRVGLWEKVDMDYI